MSSANDSVDRGSEACELCGDVAVAGTVLSINADTRTAIVELECGSATVALDLVDACVGDTLLVHVGFAITRLEVA
jgi:hydrogenase maturation factor